MTRMPTSSWQGFLLAGILLLFHSKLIRSQCAYATDSTDSVCDVCGCKCNVSLTCSEGPPMDVDSSMEGETRITITIKNAADEIDLRFITLAFTTNITIDGWSELEIRAGKFDISTKSVTYLQNVYISVVITDLPDLVSITPDTFDTIHRYLVSVKIMNCPKLLYVEARQDGPNPPLPLLGEFVLENLPQVENLGFLNSAVTKKNYPEHTPITLMANNPAITGSMTISITNLAKLKSLGVTRSLDYRADSIRITLKDLPELEGGMDICFFKHILDSKMVQIDVCNVPCFGCNYVWLQAWIDGAPTMSNVSLYPIPNSKMMGLCTTSPKCSKRNEPDVSPYDWPVRFTSSILGTERDRSNDDSQADLCNMNNRWDPFYAHHKCFYTGRKWASCLEGCDCSVSTIRCADGPFYDSDKKRLIIAGEDFPNLITIDERALMNVPSSSAIETYFIYNNKQLLTLMPDTSKFDSSLVKNVIVSQNPYLQRLDNFVSKDWSNLEYLEISGCGEIFSQNIERILNNIFKVSRLKLQVLNLNSNKLRMFPWIDFLSKAPQLRYLYLTGNAFVYLNMESLMPFYMLPKEVETLTPMLDERMINSRSYIAKTKTLALGFNPNLKCDCTMSMEHLTRVNNPDFWDDDKLTYIEVDELCKPAYSTPGCAITIEERTGCVYAEYNGAGRAMDLKCYQNGMNPISRMVDAQSFVTGLNCSNDGGQSFCPHSSIAERDYSYFYCDSSTSICKPAFWNDPLIPELSCAQELQDAENICSRYQNVEMPCPLRNEDGTCSVEIWECNEKLKVCQFKYPFKRSDYKIPMCKFQLNRHISRGFWNYQDVELARRAWVSDCGFKCSAKADCRFLESHFSGMRFCCTGAGFCSTNCFNACPAGLTGELCETDLTLKPLRCPVGWGGDLCSVKLCNKFFLCSNGAVCEKGYCACTENFFGPECRQHIICDGNPCEDPFLTYCLSTDGQSFTCPAVSHVFSKYKFLSDDLAADRLVNGECDDSACDKLMAGSKCLGEHCGCPIGFVALRKIGKPPICVQGAQPCSNTYECSTIHPDMVCSGNPYYIEKATVRPIGYVSFCLCSDPAFFHTVTGACLKERNSTADSQFLKVGNLSSGMSGAMIAIIVLGVIGIGVGLGSFFLLKRRKVLEGQQLATKREASKTGALASQLDMAQEVRQPVAETKADTDVEQPPAAPAATEEAPADTATSEPVAAEDPPTANPNNI